MRTGGFLIAIMRTGGFLRNIKPNKIREKLNKMYRLTYVLNVRYGTLSVVKTPYIESNKNDKHKEFKQVLATSNLSSLH